MNISKAAVLAVAAAGLSLAACQTTGSTAAAGDAADADVTYATGSRAAAEAAQTGEGRVICRRERVTGTLISERICLTAAEWDAVESAGREASDAIERNAVQGPVPDSPGGF